REHTTVNRRARRCGLNCRTKAQRVGRSVYRRCVDLRRRAGICDTSGGARDYPSATIEKVFSGVTRLPNERVKHFVAHDRSPENLIAREDDTVAATRPIAGNVLTIEVDGSTGNLIPGNVGERPVNSGAALNHRPPAGVDERSLELLRSGIKYRVDNSSAREDAQQQHRTRS